jgi:anti-sigma factor RsiW
VDCSKISDFLSEYVDDQLDPAIKRLVEEHMASCESCAAELASLQAYLRTMAAMEKMSAPQGFLAAVHERIEQPSVFERISKWLFYPLRIKLPMELAGLVVATLLLVFAYQQAPRQEKEKDMSSLSGEVRQSVVSTDKKGASVGQMAADRPVAVPKHIQLALSLPPPKLLEDAAQLRALAAPPSAPGKAERAGRNALKQSAPQRLPSRESVPSASVTGARDEESSAPRGPGQVYGFIQESAGSMGGTVLSVEYHKATNEPKTIVVRIPSGNYSLFLESLGRAGRVKETREEPSEAARTADESELLEIRIDLIQPE